MITLLLKRCRRTWPPLRIRVDEFSQLMMDRISGAGGRWTIFPCFSCWEVEDSADQLPSAVESDYFAMLNEPGVPPYRLQLKVGTICSIMRNLSIEKGLVKNARVRILELRRHIVQVKLLHSAASSPNDRSVYLPRINFDFHPQYTS
jgi:hypothetical protein